MSVTALYTAVSGMNANGLALSVVGDNIANMNTHGFKASTVIFGDIVSQSMGSVGIGRGTKMNDVSSEFTQGAFENSSNVLDMSVDGDGMFVVQEGNARFYTRAGQFGIDKQGYAVSSDGLKLQGYGYSASTGAASTVLGDINVSSVNSEPSPTSEVTIYANVNATESVKAAFAVGTPEDTSNFTSTLTVYDTLGTSHVLNVYYRKAQTIAIATSAATPAPDASWVTGYAALGGTEWEWYGVLGATDSQTGLPAIAASGKLEFTTSGALYDELTIATDFDFAGGAGQSQTITFDFGESIVTDASTTGLEGSTQFGSDSNTSYLSQDGYSAGSLKNVTISDEGVMTGIFTNGQTKNVAQIVLAKFISVEGLLKMGDNLYSESFESGQPIITAAGSTGTGNILSNTLELSNVDLASEFVKMIIMQRGFQANSRMVSTADELMMELVNLKR